MSIILRENEKLIKAVRRHRMFLTPVFFGWPWLIAGLAAVRYLFNFNFFSYWPWVLSAAVLIVALIILYRFFIWKRNALIITDQRVVENEQHGLFSRTVTELLYEDISQISYDKHGMNASLYNFGDIRIKTMSDSELVIEEIPEPDKVIETINNMRRQD